MAFSLPIQNALKQYDRKKGFFRRWGWLSWLFGKDSPAIRAVRALESSNQNTLFKLLQCFVQHKVKTSQTSFLVFQAVLADLFRSSSKNTPFNPKQYQDIQPLLYNEDLFTEENIKDIQQHTNPLNMTTALFALNKHPLFTSKSRVFLKESDHPDQVANLMIRLYNKQSFIQNNRCQLKEPFDLEKIINIIKMLYKTKTLTEENIAAIQERPDMEILSNTLQIFNDKQLLTQDNFNIIIKTHTKLSTLADIVQILDYKGLLTQKNFDDIFVQTNINALTITLLILYDAPLLTQDNVNLLKNHLDLPTLNQILNTLSNSNLLTQINFDLIVQHADLQNIAARLSTFQETTFTQADFEKMINDSFQSGKKTNHSLALTAEEEEGSTLSYSHFFALPPKLQNTPQLEKNKLTHRV